MSRATMVGSCIMSAFIVCQSSPASGIWQRGWPPGEGQPSHAAGFGHHGEYFHASLTLGAFQDVHQKHPFQQGRPGKTGQPRARVDLV